MVCTAVLVQLCKVFIYLSIPLNIIYLQYKLSKYNVEIYIFQLLSLVDKYTEIYYFLFLFPIPPFSPLSSSPSLPQSSTQVPPILAECIDRVFYDIRLMDRECVDRFAEWFALHLSNFQFQWNWQCWDYVFDERTKEQKKNKPFQLSFMRQVSQY